jgi:2-polyprenyl-3-methyl-5-hydroxy-6-metoxy-1,4-benzoquinol methylase
MRRAAGENVDHLLRPTLAERFYAIYKNRVWLNDRAAGSLSGLGSELVNTERIRKELPRLLAELKTKTLLDVGCGDFGWMEKTELNCRYIGVDVVEELITENNRVHLSKTRTFQTIDATVDELPKADTILCREVMFHLCFSDILKLIANIQRSTAIFLIATNDTSLRYNSDIISGDYRLLNLYKAPFHFPLPSISVPDDQVTPRRTMSVWRTSELKHRTSVA